VPPDSEKKAMEKGNDLSRTVLALIQNDTEKPVSRCFSFILKEGEYNALSSVWKNAELPLKAFKVVPEYILLKAQGEVPEVVKTPETLPSSTRHSSLETRLSNLSHRMGGFTLPPEYRTG
jgi:hypothetical protein